MHSGSTEHALTAIRRCFEQGFSSRCAGANSLVLAFILVATSPVRNTMGTLAWLLRMIEAASLPPICLYTGNTTAKQSGCNAGHCV
eukprot:11622-Heterococcus_DN1.PRE.2